MIEPKFKNAQEYELAQVLMQPIFIRLLDNIRKESELSNYDVSYEEINEPFPSYIVAIKKENKTEKKIMFGSYVFKFVSITIQKALLNL